ncbi:DUF72 domain-containing protein [Arachidicoccus sp.]|uniref:DUF72 domain-containing protein n=1 Tax=Arachidicoccus sp. TaxID=1872624 RepID=UPI003D1BABBE
MKNDIRNKGKNISQNFIGTSGWQYRHWRENFYPASIQVKDQFSYYRSQFNTVELNASFYHVPLKKTFENWASAVEDDFLFSVKANRYFTHLKKLQVRWEDLEPFLNKTLALEKHLGPILFQLPPSWKIDIERLNHFLNLLPSTVKTTFEFRNQTWYQEEVYELLSSHQSAFCIYDLGGHFSPKIVTAPFVYIRLHGPEGKYQGFYQKDFLEQMAQYIHNWNAEQRDVYVYFDNDMQGYAPKNALMLRKILS